MYSIYIVCSIYSLIFSLCLSVSSSVNHSIFMYLSIVCAFTENSKLIPRFFYSKKVGCNIILCKNKIIIIYMMRL